MGRKVLKMSHVAVKFLVFILLLAGFSSPAFADAIDGDWCNAGRHLKINGPQIVTPGGTSMTGSYDRHAFRYKIPASDKGAGENVFMVQRSEEIMNFWQTPEAAPGPQTPPQVWTRCQNISAIPALSETLRFI